MNPLQGDVQEKIWLEEVDSSVLVWYTSEWDMLVWELENARQKVKDIF